MMVEAEESVLVMAVVAIVMIVQQVEEKNRKMQPLHLSGLRRGGQDGDTHGPILDRAKSGQASEGRSFT